METNCPAPIPTFKLYGVQNHPEPRYLSKLVTKIQIVALIWTVTICILIRLGKHPARVHLSYSPAGLSVGLMVFSAGVGCYLMWVYLTTEGDPSRFCFIRFSLIMFVSSGMMSAVIAAIASFFPADTIKVSISLTLAGGFIIPFVCALVELFRVSAVTAIYRRAAARRVDYEVELE